MKSLEKNKKGPWALLITLILVVFCILWTLPTIGIFITSFRTGDAASSTGWWKAFLDLKNFTLDNYNQVLFGHGDSARCDYALGVPVFDYGHTPVGDYSDFDCGCCGVRLCVA